MDLKICSVNSVVWGDVSLLVDSQTRCPNMNLLVVYYESRKRELKTRPIYECRYDERLKSKTENLHVSHTLGCSGNWNT